MTPFVCGLGIGLVMLREMERFIFRASLAGAVQRAQARRLHTQFCGENPRVTRSVLSISLSDLIS